MGEKKDHARRPVAVVVFGLGVLEELVEISLELRQARLALERFVETVEGEDHIRLHAGQPLIARAEAFRAVPGGDLVGGGGEIAEDQIVLRKFCGDERLERAFVLHAVGDGTADEGDVVAGLEFKFGGRLGGREERASEGENKGEDALVHGSIGFREEAG